MLYMIHYKIHHPATTQSPQEGRMKIARTLIIAIIALVVAMPAMAQSRSERKAVRLAESEMPRNVVGGVSFEANISADKAFDVAVKYFQKHDIALDESSKKDLGQLVTAMRIVDVGGFLNNNKGYRTYATFIRETDSTTTVKVKVTEQVRTKNLYAEPWSDPVVMDKETAVQAEELKTALTSAVATH